MRDLDPNGLLYEYHVRIPQEYRDKGWRVTGIGVSNFSGRFRADISNPDLPGRALSESWLPRREEAVDSAIQPLINGEFA